MTVAWPPFCTAPRDFSSSVVMPPALLPGDGFSCTGWWLRRKYSLKSLTMVHDAVEHLATGGPLHQQLFGTKDFRNLGEHGSAAGLGDAIGDAADQRIRGDAAEAIGAAAFQTDDQIVETARYALVSLGELHAVLQPLAIPLQFRLRWLAPRSNECARALPRESQ